jgi:hypothetical protein
MRFACWITNATDTLTVCEYIAFPLQQRLHEPASMLRYAYIAYLVVTEMVCLLCGTIWVQSKQENRLRSVLKAFQIIQAVRHCLPHCQSLLHSSHETCFVLEMNDVTRRKNLRRVFQWLRPARRPSAIRHPQCRDSSIVPRNKKSCLHS